VFTSAVDVFLLYFASILQARWQEAPEGKTVETRTCKFFGGYCHCKASKTNIRTKTEFPSLFIQEEYLFLPEMRTFQVLLDVTDVSRHVG
jgi:hypothetical protein